MAATEDPARRGAGRAWILDAQARRRKAMAAAAAYRHLIAERRHMSLLLASLGA